MNRRGRQRNLQAVKESVSGVRHGRRALRDRAAFTLVELLVVIAIMGVLISLLFPSLQRARNRADAVAGGTALRNIGMGILNYATEQEQFLPELHYTGVFCVMWRRADKSDLLTQLSPYLGNENINSDEYVPGTASPAFLRRHAPETVPAYLANPWARDHAGRMYPFGWMRRSDFTPRLISEIRKPSEQVALIDSDNELRRENGSVNMRIHPQEGPLYDDRRMALYFDFHVIAIPEDRNFYLEKYW
jgi:prepilin-type N-terminal cleavage/methylation domain-containing protein